MGIGRAFRLVVGIWVCAGTIASGAVLTDSDLAAGKVPAPGDEVILDQFQNCFPRSAIVSESVKGKWWLRPFQTGETEGTMLCVVERDQENPQSCICTPLTYNVDLEGVYDIWVGTYRVPGHGGGIDIKLTGNKTWYYVDPREDGVEQWPPKEEKTNRLVECFYTTAEMTGQDIHLRQPYGTYESRWWGLCEAHVAYIKLIRREPVEAAEEQARRPAMRTKGVIFDRDGFSWIWNYGTEDVDCLLQQVEGMRFGNVDALNWCIGGSLSANFPHPMTTGRITGGGRLGDKRAERVFKDFEDRDLDTLQIMVDRCHEIGLKIYASHRANVRYRPSNVWAEHPDWRLDNNRGLNYAVPEARAFYREYLLYIARNYDIDGLTIDFSRHRDHFNPPQETQMEHMNTYLRELRAGLDAIAKERGKTLELNASFVCGTWYDGRTPAQMGLDVETWVKEGIVHRIMPEGKDTLKYIEMCKDSPVECYARKTRHLDFRGRSLMKNLHDPTPQQDDTDEPMHEEYPPLKTVAGVLEWYDAGADGVFLFNYQTYAALRHLPYPEIARKEVESGQQFGRKLLGTVTWLQDADTSE